MAIAISKVTGRDTVRLIIDTKISVNLFIFLNIAEPLKPLEKIRELGKGFQPRVSRQAPL